MSLLAMSVKSDHTVVPSPTSQSHLYTALSSKELGNLLLPVLPTEQQTIRVWV